jgi:hypothetical protein
MQRSDGGVRMDGWKMLCVASANVRRIGGSAGKGERGGRRTAKEQPIFLLISTECRCAR